MNNFYGFLEKKLNVKDFIVTKTDTKGIITYANQTFIQISGYSEKELLEKPHNMVRHEDMPCVVFKFLWQELKKENEVFAFVKNKGKDNSFYWVFANITPSFDDNGKVTGYYSVRRKPNPKAIDFIEKFYNDINEKEFIDGKDKSWGYFISKIKDIESYNLLINNLQRGI